MTHNMTTPPIKPLDVFQTSLPSDPARRQLHPAPLGLTVQSILARTHASPVHLWRVGDRIWRCRPSPLRSLLTPPLPTSPSTAPAPTSPTSDPMRRWSDPASVSSFGSAAPPLPPSSATPPSTPSTWRRAWSSGRI